ncbi:MAG: endonuclease III domain-containing protein [Nanobdellota archaeon]
MELEQIILRLEVYVKDLPTPAAELVKAQQGDPFHILITTILSSRTNDGTTAAAANRLFTKVNTFSDLHWLSQQEIEDLIYPVGFYRVKAKHLKALASCKHVPPARKDLLALPGVGQKTANLVLSVAFGKPAICVDVHVHRITNRLGHIATKTPQETEHELERILPQKFWNLVNRVFVPFGQAICRPLNPKCPVCPVEPYCAKRIKKPEIQKHR